MPGTVADYSIVRDTVFTLTRGVIGGDIDMEFDFSIPSTANISQSGVLAFRVNAASGTVNNLQADFLLNGTLLFTYGPTDTNITCAIHEVFGGNILRHGNNTLRVQLVGGQGSLQPSDIVVWFQNNV